MLVCHFFLSHQRKVTNDYGDDNNDGVLQQRKSQGRGMSVCVIIFPLYPRAAQSKFWGI
jgi:hypothetical protein